MAVGAGLICFQFGDDCLIEVEVEARSAIESPDDDVGEFFFEVFLIAFSKAFQGFGGFRLNKCNHCGDFVGVIPVFGSAHGPTVGAIDVVDLFSEVFEEGGVVHVRIMVSGFWLFHLKRRGAKRAR